MMEVKLVTPEQVSEWFMPLVNECHPVAKYPFFYRGGGMHDCCDEGLFLLDNDGTVLAVATISMKGEQQQGPTVLACYAMPTSRRKGYGRYLCEQAVRRLLDRGAEKVLLRCVTEKGVQLADSLPSELKKRCRVVPDPWLLIEPDDMPER
jgi:hypothetical protein